MPANRDKHVRFRTTAQERALLERAAAKEERTLSDFCRRVALAQARALVGAHCNTPRAA